MSDLSPEELDHVLERYDQTDPALQRQAVGRIMGDRIRLTEELACANEVIQGNLLVLELKKIMAFTLAKLTRAEQVIDAARHLGNSELHNRVLNDEERECLNVVLEVAKYDADYTKRLTAEEFSLLPAETRGYAAYWFGDNTDQPNIPNEHNPYAKDSDDFAKWNQGQIRACINAQDSEE